MPDVAEATPVVETPAAAPAESSPSPTPAAAEPASGEFTPPARNAEEGPIAYMQRAREAREAHAKGEVKPVTEQPAAEPAKPVEVAKPAEPVKEETPAEDDGLIPEAGMATTELAEKLKADPDLAAKLEAAGIKNAVFANARLADKAQEFIKEFPGGLEDVRFTKQYAAEREQLEQGFTSISTPQDALSFVRDTIIPMSYVLGEDGNPLKDAQGNFVTDGTVERFMDNMVGLGIQLRPDHAFEQVFNSKQGKELLLGKISSLASEGDDEMQAALEIVKDRLEKRSSSSAASEPQTAKEKELAERSAAVKAEEDRLSQQRQTEAAQREQDNERAVATSISSETNKLIDSILGKFAIPDFNKESAKEKIRKALYDRVNDDATFKMQASQNARKQYGEKTHQERVGLAVRTAKSYAWTVAEPIIRQAGGELIAANKAKHDKITTQVDATKKEPRAGLVTPSGGPAAPSNEQLVSQARENLVKAGKDPSDTKQVIAEVRRIRAGQ